MNTFCIYKVIEWCAPRMHQLYEYTYISLCHFVFFSDFTIFIKLLDAFSDYIWKLIIFFLNKLTIDKTKIKTWHSLPENKNLSLKRRLNYCSGANFNPSSIWIESWKSIEHLQTDNNGEDHFCVPVKWTFFSFRLTNIRFIGCNLFENSRKFLFWIQSTDSQFLVLDCSFLHAHCLCAWCILMYTYQKLGHFTTKQNK